ncbi:MAG: XisH family protein [Leptospiraceae bacterium]|nr:XisH family protein [Leptospiraceae bacterium]MCP5497641.1 XisH family protein [Leptospiraceae bacterium]
MSAKDIYHDLVKNALIKEGWVITHDPYYIKYEQDFRMYIDLGAEKVIAAIRDNKKIAIEIKSFLDPSPISDFHNAVGQYVNYRIALEDTEPDRELFLAVPKEVYSSFMRYTFFQKAIAKHKLKLIVFHPDKEEIQKWIN